MLKRFETEFRGRLLKKDKIGFSRGQIRIYKITNPDLLIFGWHNLFYLDMGNRNESYDRIKPMIASGDIKIFSDIFKHVPKTVVARDLGKKGDRFSQLIKQPEGFVLKDLFIIATFCKIDETQIFALVLNEYLANKQK